MSDSDESDIIAAGRRVPFAQTGMIVHPDDCSNCERGGHPLWCSPIVADIRDDERWGMTATLLYRTGEVREEPCQELRRRWRLARDFDQTMRALGSARIGACALADITRGVLTSEPEWES